jgi:histidyl-tRNA synthetase
MLPDAEICNITVEVFITLGLKDFKIKINHRRILDSIFRVCGVKDELVRPISSAVDKLDKLPWSEVKTEMLQKGIDEVTADKVKLRPYRPTSSLANYRVDLGICTTKRLGRSGQAEKRSAVPNRRWKDRGG